MTQSELLNMSLKEASLAISQSLVNEKLNLENQRDELKRRKQGYEQNYITANTGDSSENAPLDAAKKNLRLITGEIATNAMKLQTLDSVEDMYFVRNTYDYTLLQNEYDKLNGDLKQIVSYLFKMGNKTFTEMLKVVPYKTYMEAVRTIEGVLGEAPEFENLHARLCALIPMIEIMPYNSPGVVVPYTTVKLLCNGKTMVYKIYLDGLSIIDKGILAGDSRLAQALIGKRKGDKVTIQHKSNRTQIVYELLDIY